MHKPRIMFVFGTRPEVIKLAPVIKALDDDGAMDVKVCVTAQHREMMDQFLSFFGLIPHADLDLMTHDQSLAAITAHVITRCSDIYTQLKPDMVFVQGDTSSAFAATVAATLQKIPVAHVEAGLRSHNRDSPFPEETNRVLISHMANLHFAHTESAAENLRKEGIARDVFVVGNTVVDALQLALSTIDALGEAPYFASFPAIDFNKKLVLVTLHRRESIGTPLMQTCLAIKQIAETHPGVELVYPVHRNPRVKKMVHDGLGGLKNVHLLDPLDYPNFIWLLSKASLVITDSGGVVEEASTLGVPILVAREVTERAEAVEAGAARMVGCNAARIIKEAKELLRMPAKERIESLNNNVFGDGKASQRIVEITRRYLHAGPAAKECIAIPAGKEG
jgi:UDP-N-acetylglucosamine 2-epimerase (non-hydrolysing)